ncbi:hypothetical protein BJ165DRAFT_1452054 [Panaeolus papilionaceus]|nr:hypothetical protein BJ165DRAFT_1452054 [Panaeolus papilionaceus]
MCFTNMILIPHDIDRLLLKELKHLATGPSRTLRLLEAHRQPPKADRDDIAKYLVPKRTTRVPSKTKLEVDQMNLIPGGRYMVTLAYDVFNLWDLGASPDKRPVSLKQWTHPTDDGVILTYAPTSDQKGLRLLVSSSR